VLAALVVLAGGNVRAQPVAPRVVKLSIHDTIQPITADYLKRGLDEAASRHADAVLISLGTPGGLLSSTREMVAAIEGSPVPVIVFIEPAGSRAGSAGFWRPRTWRRWPRARMRARRTRFSKARRWIPC
jgi:membrane-bound serine protease (ClpP class)